MSQLNICKDYFQPGQKHVCRFCQTPIAKNVDGVLRALGNKAHVQCVLESGTVHRFNCCLECAEKIDWKSGDALQQVWEHDCEIWKNIEVLEGESQKEAEKRMHNLKKQRVIPNFVFVEKSLSEGLKGEKSAKEAFKKHSKIKHNKKGVK